MSETKGAPRSRRCGAVGRGDGSVHWRVWAPKAKQVNFATFFNDSNGFLFDPRIFFDPVWQRWHAQREGLYASNGAAIGFVYRSAASLPEPDVFCMALPTRFEGYFQDFSRYLQTYHDRLTWAVLKAHTHNRAGTVSLRSSVSMLASP